MINIEITRIINILGKYIHKQISGSYKFAIRSNGCDVYSIVYYQVPQISETPGEPDSYSDVYEMDLQINIVTYQKYIRINIYELSPDETTLGFLKYDPEKFKDINTLKNKCLQDVKDRICDRYDKYEFVF